MNVNKEVGKTKFFDRLYKTFRVKRNGVLERLGGWEGGIKVRLVCDPSSSIPYLVLHHASNLICKAKITEKVQEVSEDGYTIHLHLHEESIHQFKRRYIFVFHDEDASINFFQIYEELRGRKDGDHTFWDLQEETAHKNNQADNSNFYFISGEEELKLNNDDFARNFSNLKIAMKEELDHPCNRNDGSEKNNGSEKDYGNGDSDNELDIKEEDLKDDNSPSNDLPSLDDFSQDVYALNTHVVLEKKW